MRERIKKIAKSLINRAGYTLRRTSGIPFGDNVWNDVGRLSTLLKRPVETVFDVGANNGDTTLEVTQKFPNSKVYAFEPHPQTYRAFTSRIRDPRVVPVHEALGDEVGIYKFYDYGGTGHVNSLVPNARYAERFDIKPVEIDVTVNTLDRFCGRNDISKIDVLKIDTEGNDLAVLKGSKAMLGSSRIDFIQFEFNDFVPKGGTVGGSLNEISAYLAPYDFHFIATYTDYIVTDGELFVVANALLARGDSFEPRLI